MNVLFFFRKEKLDEIVAKKNLHRVYAGFLCLGVLCFGTEGLLCFTKGFIFWGIMFVIDDIKVYPIA